MMFSQRLSAIYRKICVVCQIPVSQKTCAGVFVLTLFGLVITGSLGDDVLVGGHNKYHYVLAKSGNDVLIYKPKIMTVKSLTSRQAYYFDGGKGLDVLLFKVPQVPGLNNVDGK